MLEDYYNIARPPDVELDLSTTHEYEREDAEMEEEEEGEEMEQDEEIEEDEEMEEGTSLSWKELASDETILVDESALDDPLNNVWYGHLMDVWMADIRIDTPLALLLFLARVGSRYTSAIDRDRCMKHHLFEHRLSDQSIPAELIRPLGKDWQIQQFDNSNVKTPYVDHKNILLSRLWMPKPSDLWLRGRVERSNFYDKDRGVWVMDIGDHSSHVQTLSLLRCYNGPALPTVIPDLRMRHLYYSVPVYRLGNGKEEDLDRIRKHGRIDRMLILPKERMVFDRVAFSSSAFETAGDWNSGISFRVVSEDPTHPVETYVPPYGWLTEENVQQDLPPDSDRLVYGGRKLLQILNRGDSTLRDFIKNTRSRFVLPDETCSRVNLKASLRLWFYKMTLDNYTADMEKFEWTNILFTGTDYDKLLEPLYLREGLNALMNRYEEELAISPVQDMLTALETATTNIPTGRCWLTLHPTLRNINGLNLGQRVEWSKINFPMFNYFDTKQFSVRLGMTMLPSKKRGDKIHYHHLAFLDRIRQRGPRNTMRHAHFIQNNQPVIIDFSYNAIEKSEHFENCIRTVNNFFPNPKEAGFTIFIGGNPATEMEESLGYLGVFNAVDLARYVSVIHADKKMSHLLGNEGVPDPTFTQRANRFARIKYIQDRIKHYEAPVNTDDTVPGGTLVVLNRPGPDTNPYGSDWKRSE